MNSITSSNIHALLILTPQDGDAARPLLRAAMRQHYQSPNIIWHVVLLLPPLLSYAFDQEQFQIDWTTAVKQRHEARTLLKLPYWRAHYIHGHTTKVRRHYKKLYPGLILPVNRPLLERSVLRMRWVWRKTKRSVKRGFLTMLSAGRGFTAP